MSLEHQLGSSSAGIPELNTTVLGSGEDPVRIGRERNREDKVSVTLEGLDTLAALGSWVGTISCAELPHLDGSIQAATDKFFAARRESDRVNRVLVAVRTLQTFDEETRVNIPHPNALVQ